MRTQILINTHPLETRVAFLEDGVLTDFEVEREQRIVGSLFKGRVVNVLPGMDAAFVDIGRRRNAYIYVGDVDPARLSETSRRRTRYASIAEALTVGEDLIVQVVRPPVGSKGPRVTTRLSLQGRYSVLMIASPGHLGVSRQI
ncbi:MAG: ribonuclease G, partial [Armatimonadetes bacterium CG_4_8_14_3_um_filter_66_20]